MVPLGGRPSRTVVVGEWGTRRVTRHELAQSMLTDCMAARASPNIIRPKLVFSSNGQGLALAGRSSRFMAVMSQADVIHADGMPVVLASRLTAHPLPERIATTDFFHDVAQVAEISGLRFFFLGASEDQNRAAVASVSKRYPKLQISGRHHGYFSTERKFPRVNSDPREPGRRRLGGTRETEARVLVG